MHPPYDPAMAFLGIRSRESKTYIHTNIHMDVYNSFIPNSQKPEAN